jgi:uncharacterized membrane protein
MKALLNKWLDRASNYFAYRKGLLPFLGLILVLLNWLLQFIPGIGWLNTSNTLLHLGTILAIIGFMLAWAL